MLRLQNKCLLRVCRNKRQKVAKSLWENIPSSQVSRPNFDLIKFCKSPEQKFVRKVSENIHSK